MGMHQPLYPNTTRAMDFQFDQTADTRPIKLLNIIDEYSRECLASTVGRSFNAKFVVAILDNLLGEKGKPYYLRVDGGPEFISKALALWYSEVGVILWFIEPGSLLQSGKVAKWDLSTEGSEMSF